MTLDRRDFLRSGAAGMVALAFTPEFESLFPRAPSGETLKLGIIGTGVRGCAALEELATIQGCAVVSIADVDKGRRNRGKRRAPDAMIYESGGELLDAGGIDAVIIAASTFAHRELTEQALAKRVKVYLEAPLAHNETDAAAIAAACFEDGAWLTAGFTANSNPVYKRARDVFQSGALRDLVSLRTHWRRKLSWKAAAPTPERERALSWKIDPERSAGLCGEIASQHVHTMRWFTGKSPRSVRGWGGIRLWQGSTELPDTVQLDFGWDNELRCQQELTLASSIGGEELVISGTHGTIRLAGRHAWLFKEPDAATQGWEVYAHRERFHQDEGYVLLANATKLAAQGKLQDGAGLPHTELWYALQAFVTAAVENAEPPCPIQEAMQSTIAGIKAAETIATGKEVLLDLID
ncbi:MAG: Gfo/Idh/MocA family oxidoreductase, partial [Planctomycetes bacterium]|nr:Gfo/Idh/MocA family oxidoreductase [Planctomycetota bacterium]